jgi:hypothetical protein
MNRTLRDDAGALILTLRRWNQLVARVVFVGMRRAAAPDDGIRP